VIDRAKVCGEGELCALEFDRYRNGTFGDPNPRQMCSGALPDGACSGAVNSESRFIACCNYSQCTETKTFTPMYLSPTTTAEGTPLVTAKTGDGRSVGDTGAGVYECVYVCVRQREYVSKRKRECQI
jgi:hypothetical protein